MWFGQTFRRWLAPVPGGVALGELITATVRICQRHRATGLATEAAYFALLSLPPVLLGVFGGVGYVGDLIGEDNVARVTERIADYASRVFTPEIIDSLLRPTVDDVFSAGRSDLISVGFLLSLWSGSRMLNVLLDTIAIMYGQGGARGMVQTRVMSLSIYFGAIASSVVLMPLLLIGPDWLAALLPEQASWLALLYWPVVSVLAVVSITTLFHIATPQRSRWRRDLPGGLLTLLLWAAVSWGMRLMIEMSLGGTSIYGPLSTPIVLLIWLYFLALSILVGAAFNAVIRSRFPIMDADRSIAAD
ncbi:MULTISPECIES: YihY/virulence factor BrkB family protein [unclassified Janibacter]|uniref:YihY/virulence factor BrkB family protein n=1 Tax=unclassified Janibacter TaxID=2649294 RepID=UPI003D079D3C